MTNLHKLLTAPSAQKSSPQRLFWFSLSLTFAAIYGWMALQKAFDGKYIVQDDARQHVFWMQRFLDPQLFPGDLIANYFQSVAPAGYTTVYRLMAAVGIEPLLLSKLLPLVLGLITTAYCFGCTLQLLPVPLAGFISSLLLNQSLWMKFDVVSATPRAFVYPLFLGFLYYLLRGNLIATCGAIALLGLFYPQYVFICSGLLILRLLQWKNGRFSWVKTPRDYRFSATGLAVAFLVMLPYALKSNEYGPVLKAAEAIALPELWPGGRNPFFNDNPAYFWLIGERSGILPPLLPPLIWLGIFLPFVLRYPSRFPLFKHIAKETQLFFFQMAVAAVGMFLAAHAVLFRLHLPSRYIEHSFRVILALASGILLTVLLDGALCVLIQQNQRQWTRQKLIALSSSVLLTAALVLYPVYTKSFPRTNYRPGRLPQLYEFFQKQPKDITIASLSGEANQIPTFSHRSILVGREYAIPYHVGYYREFSQRTRDLIRAQYTSDLAEVQKFIEQYKIDFWLVQRSAFTPEYVAEDSWLRQYREDADTAIAQLQSGTLPVVARAIERCAIFQTGDFVVLQADCIVIK